MSSDYFSQNSNSDQTDGLDLFQISRFFKLPFFDSSILWQLDVSFIRVSCLSGLVRRRWQRLHAAEDVDEVVQSPQVAVLSVTLHPGCPVVQDLMVGQGHCLPKVDHPHLSLPRAVVHEQ